MSQEAITMVCPISFTRGRAGSKKIGQKRDSVPASLTEGRIPRVSRIMALTIKLGDDLLSGKLRDYADVARLGRITRARATQIMNLQHLAPDIQEAVLFLPRTFAGRDAVTEHDLRAVATAPGWDEQRRLWKSLL
jgi:hypothetical protein